VNDVPAGAKAQIGRLLRGKWRLDRFLGGGGAGWVFSATHRNRSRVAVKLLLPELAVDGEMRQLFLREGYAANTIGHPGVVLVFDDDFDDDGSAFLVMELLEGASLDVVRHHLGGRLAPKIVLAIADKVLDVLIAAHDRGVVHRDIKPANLFLLRDGRLKVLDFGIAQLGASGSREQSRRVMGSVAYMAPEQARGQWDKVDAKSDLWALGATLFRLLTGHYVHDVTNLTELWSVAENRPARSLSSVARELSPALVKVVDRALSFDPSERWPDARALRRALALVAGSLEPVGDVDLSFLLSDYPLRASALDGPTSLDLASRVAVTVADSPKRIARAPVVSRSRRDVLADLAALGIRDSDVRLLDTIPLIEMMWADGAVQIEERQLLEAFLRAHVKNVNELCHAEVITLEQARSFADRFLKERPEPGLLVFLRELLVGVGDDGAAGVMSQVRRRAVLDFCLDIGAACVAEYPHGDHDRFCREEKLVFESMFKTLGG
jgi:serine/threonine protein kinase